MRKICVAHHTFYSIRLVLEHIKQKTKTQYKSQRDWYRLLQLLISFICSILFSFKYVCWFLLSLMRIWYWVGCSLHIDSLRLIDILCSFPVWHFFFAISFLQCARPPWPNEMNIQYWREKKFELHCLSKIYDTKTCTYNYLPIHKENNGRAI